ncbi:hypothetical protein J6590_039963 [Homalodisca vitripennis]|nr:hypothetical protein J6590_039963 [Homalodisca vitripennis]
MYRFDKLNEGNSLSKSTYSEKRQDRRGSLPCKDSPPNDCTCGGDLAISASYNLHRSSTTHCIVVSGLALSMTFKLLTTYILLVTFGCREARLPCKDSPPNDCTCGGDLAISASYNLHRSSTTHCIVVSGLALSMTFKLLTTYILLVTFGSLEARLPCKDSRPDDCTCGGDLAISASYNLHRSSTTHCIVVSGLALSMTFKLLTTYILLVTSGCRETRLPCKDSPPDDCTCGGDLAISVSYNLHRSSTTHCIVVSGLALSMTFKLLTTYILLVTFGSLEARLPCKDSRLDDCTCGGDLAISASYNLHRSSTTHCIVVSGLALSMTFKLLTTYILLVTSGCRETRLPCKDSPPDDCTCGGDLAISVSYNLHRSYTTHCITQIKKGAIPPGVGSLSSAMLVQYCDSVVPPHRQ